MPTETRLAQMTRLRHEVSAMASTLEAAEAMPGGGTLQASLDTAWHALIALHLGIEDWLARQPEHDGLTTLDLRRQAGWWPWIPQDARDIDHAPYGYRAVEIARAEWETPQQVDPRTLDPMMNVVDLWWRPVSVFRMAYSMLDHA